jgi:prolycopene isomerase
MRYDVVVIGAGLSGLTAASLLVKRGLRVAVVDNNYKPGGSCGIFKRNNIIFDQGAAMLFGFGEKGFNAHRFVFNCLEEPIEA